MNVVAIDTAGPVIGVALSCGGEVAIRQQRTKRGSEQLLAPWVEELLSEAGLARSELDGVGVCKGPGAFTGLRVGLATAAGLAMGLDIPVWSCDSLTPRALRLGGGEVLSMLDARKGRVYAARFSDGRLVDDIVDEDPASVMARQESPFVATGEGAVVYEDLVRAGGGALADGADDPSVAILARLTADALSRGEGFTALELEPFYLRAPDAVVPRSMRNE